MIATPNKVYYSYDKQFDVLRVTSSASKSFYYDEVIPGFLLRYDDESDRICGYMITNLTKSNIFDIYEELPPNYQLDFINILKDIKIKYN